MPPSPIRLPYSIRAYPNPALAAALGPLLALSLTACQVDRGGVSGTPAPGAPKDAAADRGGPNQPDAEAGLGPSEPPGAPDDASPETDATAPDVITREVPAPEDAAAVDQPPDLPSTPTLPARCATLPALPVAARRLGVGPNSDDLTFDRDGHLLAFDGPHVVRVLGNLALQSLARGAIGQRGGALRALPNGQIFLADYERDALLVVAPEQPPRTLPRAVASPMKMVHGPGGSLYVTGQRGVIYRVDPTSGTVTAAASTSLTLGGLTFTLDHRRLLVGETAQDHLQVFDVEPDGTLTRPRLFRSGVANAEALATDDCGHVYILSENDGRVRRLRDAARPDIPPGPLETVAALDEPYLWSLAFGSGQHGWSALSLYVLDAAAAHLYELPTGTTAAPSPQ